ncbi:hypothetical protein VNO80_25826 [Phaseolus coccineus]|uniref:Bulb-type lectin domain-containing protein n=1 Tax=Phaseolus coccineus TaxID=3886 RepID=A0AAN9LVH5_PHACN
MRLILHKLLVFMYSWVWWSTFIHLHAADDSLKPGETLNYTAFSSQTLYSKSRKYLLDFSTTTNGHYFATYLGIRSAYDEDEKAAVWKGNREQSIDHGDAVLSLNFSGVLKIESQYGRKPTTLLYSPPQPINNTVVTLLDTGNFVLQHLHPNGTNTLLWQSFDDPTDTLVPTKKLGVNHKTGHRWILVSQLTNVRATPEEAQGVLKYSIVSNGDEDTFSFTSTNESHTRWWFLSDTGRLYYNKSEGYVARADLCYGYNNTDGGCQKWQNIPKCRNPGDMFTKKILQPNYKSASYHTVSSINHADCEAKCWSDCDCSGFTEIFDDGTGCALFQWNSTKDYVVDNTISGQVLYILENARNITPHHHDTKRWIWISPVIATSLLILCAISILCLAIKKRKHVLQEKQRKEMTLMEDFGNDLNKKHGLKVLDYTLVVAATNEFSSENKLGQGGFGPVYKVIETTHLISW